MLLGVSVAWKSKSVLAAGYGLATAGDRSGNPRPAVSKGQLIQLISANGWRKELSILILLSWTFLLRAPPKCLPLYRSPGQKDLSSGNRVGSLAAIGVSEGNLIVELNRRTHMAGGSKLIRVCPCEEYAPDALELHAPRLFCPVCQLGPVARRPASAGERLVPGRAGK